MAEGESWSHLGDVYNGTYQRSSTTGYFYAFMDFKPEVFSSSSSLSRLFMMQQTAQQLQSDALSYTPRRVNTFWYIFLKYVNDAFMGASETKSTVTAALLSYKGPFKVITKYRTICGIGHQDLAPCKHVIFDNNTGTVTVTVDVYRGDINGERYGIFTCQSEDIEDLHHVVDFGVETPTA
ncbi:unnamed protein product [Dibothriocephalus latus]|uniref:Uncharacterized protein n=1 Tax=Dibothriocephalus latus TaxID=60516 RepID=A0A3P6SNK1_DIBLA|nr:unnamed protein product [Dibothriocephalus latus]